MQNKKTLLRNAILSVLLVVGITMIFGGAQVTVPLAAGLPVSKTSKTFVSGQVDTITFNREAGLSALSFSIRTKDSSNITSIVLRRAFDGILSPVVATDTLSAVDSSASDRAIIKTITLAPLSDQYKVIVTYNTDDGGINQGTTTPTVVYGFNKQFSK